MIKYQNPQKQSIPELKRRQGIGWSRIMAVLSGISKDAG
jgi:hypothetical protein